MEGEKYRISAVQRSLYPAVGADMKRLAALALLFLFIACASSDYDEPQRRPARRGGASGGFGYRPQASGALDMLPPPQWWHDPQIAAAVTLTNEQFASLDKV